MIWLAIPLLLVGFGLLIKGADWLVEGAASIARRYGITDIVIGLTVVAFGTSAPELAVNLFSALSGNAALALGNVIGSNIANILLILGIAGVLAAPLAIGIGTVWREIPLALLASFVVLINAADTWLDGSANLLISRSDGVVMLFFFAIFLYYTFSIRHEGSEPAEPKKSAAYSLPTSIGFFGFGLAGLLIGGQLIVRSATEIALAAGVSQTLIGLTIVAIGTSLPELAATVVAAWKKRMGLAVGNIVGSNIFNVFLILGLTATISPLPVNPSLLIDLTVAVIASLLLFVAMFIGPKHRLERWEAIVFLSLYVIYLGYLGWRQ